jgi:uncharacterized protein YoxC
MSAETDKEFLQELNKRVQTIKTAALELQDLSDDVQAVYRNADRILASVKMLEINVSDVLDLV